MKEGFEEAMMDGSAIGVEVASAPEETGASSFDADESQESAALWLGDAGALPYDARCAFLQLVRGPFIDENRDAKLWSALLNEREAIGSRLADMFLELVIDLDHGVAFARNAHAVDLELPKAARSVKMTLLDTIMILLLRKELVMNPLGRTIVGQDEIFEQMASYRRLDKQDPAKFREKLKTSWNKLAEARILVRSDMEERYEISPVLRILFDADQAEAINDELAALAEEKRGGDDERQC